MSARLNLGPLAAGVIDGLRGRRRIGMEPEDRGTKLVLFGVPIAVFIVSLLAGLELPEAGQLVPGTALMVGAMLTGFGQLAGWRARLTDSARSIDEVKMRAIDEAVAHVLASVLVAAVLTALLAVAANVSTSVILVPVSSLAVAGLAYLVVSLFIVVNLLWDGYRAANPPAKPTEHPYDQKVE